MSLTVSRCLHSPPKMLILHIMFLIQTFMVNIKCTLIRGAPLCANSKAALNTVSRPSPSISYRRRSTLSVLTLLLFSKNVHLYPHCMLCLSVRTIPSE